MHINLEPVGRSDGVLHLRMLGKRISQKAADCSIQATSSTIHKCKVCTIVVEMGECKGVSPLALPVTARFLLSHPELKHILIIEAKGAVLWACRMVKRLSGHDKMTLYPSWAAFESACSSGRIVPSHRRSALQVASRLRAQRQGGLEPLRAGLDSLKARLRTAVQSARST